MTRQAQNKDQNLPYSFDLLFDIKTMDELRKEVFVLESRLTGLKRLMKDHHIELGRGVFGNKN